MKKIFVFLGLILLATNVFAVGKFSFNATTRSAYKKALSLRFTEARNLLAKEKAKNPHNLAVPYIENYIDLFTVFINEDKAEFVRLEKNKNKRLAFIKKHGNKSSPYYLYTLAEIRLHWAIARAKFEEYVTAFMEVRKAFKLLESNQKKYPNFVANKKSLGMLHAAVGTIPDSYKWGANLLGLDGDIDQGKREIEEVLRYAKNNDFIFEEETLVMYSFLLLHLGNQGEDAWKIIRSKKLDPKTNPLACFVQSSVAMHTGRNDEAVRILESRPKSRVYHDFLYLDYMLGLGKLYSLDADADVALKHYVKNFKGLNYIKEAYQKLAWHSLLNGDKAGYSKYMSLCKTRGNTVIEGDKKALKEAKKGSVPNITLLKAQLLFDGGYYKRAEALLKGQKVSSFSSTQHKLEVTYRKGRVAHKLKKYEAAIIYYQATIDVGRDMSYYFACNSALQIGLIHEEKKDYTKARAFYKECLSMKPDEHRNGLHQKAKAGLSRIKKK